MSLPDLCGPLPISAAGWWLEATVATISDRAVGRHQVLTKKKNKQNKRDDISASAVLI